MIKKERDEKRAARAAARQRKLEARIPRDWDRAIREDTRRKFDHFCRREFRQSLDEVIQAVREKNGRA